VAADVGFGDERYFRRIFKRHVGLTPGQFQRLRPSG
jgi:AraC-like DNA-binding protein